MKRFEFGKNNRDKRNTNNANNLENGKSKKKISKDLKARFSSLEIKPQFLIIGLVAIITVISLIYLIFLKYSPIMNFKYENHEEPLKLRVYFANMTSSNPKIIYAKAE